MKFKFSIFVFLQCLISLVINLNLKHKIVEVKSLHSEFKGSEEFRFKEKGWGILDVMNNVKKDIEEHKNPNETAEGAAKEVKNDIDCFFKPGGCEGGEEKPEGETPAQPKPAAVTPVAPKPQPVVSSAKPMPSSNEPEKVPAQEFDNSTITNTTTITEEIITTTTTTTETTETTETTTETHHVEEYFEFPLSRKEVQGLIDPRYVIMRPQDEYANPDSTLRFIATDTVNLESVSLKLYFKTHPFNKVFYSQDADPTFENSRDDCKMNQVINKRLYDDSVQTTQKSSDEFKGKKLFDDINLPKCITVPDNGSLKTSYINVYSLPEGIRLDKKCLKDDEMNKQNSCHSNLRTISKGLLHAIHIFNMGSTFYRHGNIFTHNVYLLIKSDFQRVFLDNMLYDSNKYTNVEQKPFRRDFNMLADALIELLTGTKKFVLKEPLKSTFELWHQVRSYFVDNSIDISLKSASLNMVNAVKDGSSKLVTRSEFEYRLQKSIFNFIYRLKCTGTDPYNQFDTIRDALNHDFISSGDLIGAKSPGEQWEAIPADY